MAQRIYTKTGDQGQTGLFGGQRVEKSDLRVEAYGTVDELNAWLGEAAARTQDEALRDTLCYQQGLLFELGGALATPDEGKRASGLAAKDVTELERSIDAFETQLTPLKAFILPGGTPAACAIHLARTVCRRAERLCVALSKQVSLPEHAITYLNRLGDFLFVLARVANKHDNRGDVEWHPRQS